MTGPETSEVEDAAGADAPIWLVGMMGCGKSTVGPLLAQQLGRPFLDSDAEIEKRAGQSIAEVFRREGEARFRAREASVIDGAKELGAVVALGGGAIAQAGAARKLAASGIVVYLRARPATLLDRIGDPSTRPLLAGLSKPECLQRLSALLAEREGAYSTASIVVETDGRSALAVAGELADRLGAGSGTGENQRRQRSS